jgi:hypothetical protein
MNSREDQTTARSKYRGDLMEVRMEVVYVIQHQARNDTIKGFTQKRERFERCLDPDDWRVGDECPPCASEHAMRQIQSHNRDSRLSQDTKVSTCTASEIQQPTAGKQFDHGQQEAFIEQCARIGIIILLRPSVVGISGWQPFKGITIAFHTKERQSQFCLI